MSLPKGTIGRLRWLREGAQVERAHTVRHIGGYSVGEHSHGVAVIILALYPECSKWLLSAALLHDLHEVHTGDMPAFAKTPDFREVEDAVSGMLGTKVNLDINEQSWLHAADRLDLLLWCREQQEMGNRNVDRIYQAVMGWFTPSTCPAPAEVREAALDYAATRSWPIGAN